MQTPFPVVMNKRVDKYLTIDQDLPCLETLGLLLSWRMSTSSAGLALFCHWAFSGDVRANSGHPNQSSELFILPPHSVAFCVAFLFFLNTSCIRHALVCFLLMFSLLTSIPDQEMCHCLSFSLLCTPAASKSWQIRSSSGNEYVNGFIQAQRGKGERDDATRGPVSSCATPAYHGL
ncbi:unnamed protein product [Pipistrellus nathusii]|uniref:Uncharacterized protein n=1 Tax=Pipistrellus nathusii TaxID=59473 RepID=A0ABN9ZEW5_PIPNA